MLAACGGGSAGTTAAETTASSSSASPPTDSVFCTRATTTLNSLAPAFSAGGSDPASLAPVLANAAAKVKAIQPPAEIRADWVALTDGLAQFAAAYAGAAANAHDPATASAFAAKNNALLASLSGAVTHVEAYMTKNCGLTDAPTGSAAPSS